MPFCDMENTIPGSRNSHRRYRLGPDGVRFEKAASSLSTELDEMTECCNSINNQFRQDMERVRHWTPPHIIERLDVADRLDGIDARKSASLPVIIPVDRMKTFTTHTYRLLEAMHAMKRADPPPMRILDDPRCKISPMEVRMAMRKLEAVFEEIEHLVHEIREHQDNMRPFVALLHDVSSVLRDIDAVWRGPEQHRNHSEYYTCLPKPTYERMRRNQRSTLEPLEATSARRGHLYKDFEGRPRPLGRGSRDTGFHAATVEEIDDCDGYRSYFTNASRD